MGLLFRITVAQVLCRLTLTITQVLEHTLIGQLTLMAHKAFKAQLARQVQLLL
jgi:hypothetical protein